MKNLLRLIGKQIQLYCSLTKFPLKGSHGVKERDAQKHTQTVTAQLIRAPGDPNSTFKKRRGFSLKSTFQSSFIRGENCSLEKHFLFCLLFRVFCIIAQGVSLNTFFVLAQNYQYQHFIRVFDLTVLKPFILHTVSVKIQ